jgi:hypothetical protein
VPLEALGCVPASVVTPFVLVTAFHTFACWIVEIAAPIANGNVAGVGVGVGVGVGFGGVVGAHPLTLMTGTVPDEENATLHPAGATTANGIVTLTEPFVVTFDAVVVAGAGDVVDGVCPASCAPRRIAKITNRTTGTMCRVFTLIIGPF